MCSNLIIKTPERLFTVFTVNFGHILHLFLLFVVDLGQVNVSLVPSYQFTNAITAAITYRCTKISVKWQLIRKGCDPK